MVHIMFCRPAEFPDTTKRPPTASAVCVWAPGGVTPSNVKNTLLRDSDTQAYVVHACRLDCDRFGHRKWCTSCFADRPNSLTPPKVRPRCLRCVWAPGGVTPSNVKN